jgi:rhodanese-related sulfurtransferase
MAFQNLSRLKPDEIRSRSAAGEGLLTIDVRTDGARLAEPVEIPGSHWLPLADIALHAVHLPRDVTIVTYCT